MAETSRFFLACINILYSRTFILLYTLPAMCIPLSTMGKFEILATDSKCGKSECRLFTFAGAMWKIIAENVTDN